MAGLWGSANGAAFCSPVRRSFTSEASCRTPDLTKTQHERNICEVQLSPLARNSPTLRTSEHHRARLCERGCVFLKDLTMAYVAIWHQLNSKSPAANRPLSVVSVESHRLFDWQLPALFGKFVHETFWCATFLKLCGGKNSYVIQWSITLKFRPFIDSYLINNPRADIGLSIGVI